MYKLERCPDCGKLMGRTGNHQNRCDKSLKIEREKRAKLLKESYEYLDAHPENDGRKNCWWLK